MLRCKVKKEEEGTEKKKKRKQTFSRGSNTVLLACLASVFSLLGVQLQLDLDWVARGFRIVELLFLFVHVLLMWYHLDSTPPPVEKHVGNIQEFAEVLVADDEAEDEGRPLLPESSATDSPEQSSFFFSRATFSWASPLLWTALRNGALKEDDLWPLLPSDRAKRLNKMASDVKSPSVWKMIWAMFGAEFMSRAFVQDDCLSSNFG